MATTFVKKKTFSLQPNIASYIETYNNKSQFVNEAVGFYIEYLKNVQQFQESFLENKIQEALEGDFYHMTQTPEKNNNILQYKSHGKKLENNLLVSMKE
ncbi:hypothetical protein MK079_01365 [Candidatus Gracilibacteria bacterium]|nr:hypothetical protein [Candidatus Gracilibacteria bacterium]